MNAGEQEVPAGRAENDNVCKLLEGLSFVCRVATFAGMWRIALGWAGPSLPDRSASDGPCAAARSDMGCPTLSRRCFAPHGVSACRKVSPTAGNRHVDLPPATRKPCAAAARSPEHRLAERRLRQVFGCRPPREGSLNADGQGCSCAPRGGPAAAWCRERS